MPAMSSSAPFGLCGYSPFARSPSGVVYFSAIWSFSFISLRISGVV